jgi:hypothetical protein
MWSRCRSFSLQFLHWTAGLTSPGHVSIHLPLRLSFSDSPNKDTDLPMAHVGKRSNHLHYLSSNLQMLLILLGEKVVKPFSRMDSSPISKSKALLLMKQVPANRLILGSCLSLYWNDQQLIHDALQPFLN